MAGDEPFSTFDLIVELRGGLPLACDFCGQSYADDRQPVPEEGGEWACTECVDRWAVTDKNEPQE